MFCSLNRPARVPLSLPPLGSTARSPPVLRVWISHLICCSPGDGLLPVSSGGFPSHLLLVVLDPVAARPKAAACGPPVLQPSCCPGSSVHTRCAAVSLVLDDTALLLPRSSSFFHTRSHTLDSGPSGLRRRPVSSSPSVLSSTPHCSKHRLLKRDKKTLETPPYSHRCCHFA